MDYRDNPKRSALPQTGGEFYFARSGEYYAGGDMDLERFTAVEHYNKTILEREDQLRLRYANER
jgi:hypothetical protein